MEREDARALVKKVIAYARRATEVEVTLGGGRSAVTRFANNHIHQNVAEAWPHVSVRVGLRKGKKWHTGRSATTRLDEASLKRVVARAIEAARLSRPDPSYLEMVYPDEAGSWSGDVSGSYVEDTARSGPAVRAHTVAKVVLPARKRGLSASGQVTVTDGSIGNYGNAGIQVIANNRGLFQYYRSTYASMSCTVQHKLGSTGWAEASSRSVHDLPAEALGARAMEKAETGTDPRALEPGRYTVVLEPAATASLMSFLLPTFSRQVFDEGRSAVGDALGERIFPPKLSIIDDPFHPLHQGRPFDGEGIPTKRVELVRLGVVKGFVYNRRTATKHKLPLTGHSPTQPSAGPARTRSPVVTGGKGKLEDLIGSVERGLLVTRLWYNRFVDFREARATGMTRDGLFLIEGGQIVSGVRNMRYDMSVIDVLKQTSAFSREVRAANMVVPALKVEDFNFTGVTEF